MRRLILLTACLVLAVNAMARPAGKFGYGKPPTYEETQQLVVCSTE